MTSGENENSATEKTLRTRDRVARLAIIGCGAVTRKKLLPATSLSTRLQVTSLVDIDQERARTLAREFGISEACRNIADIRGADIAVVAVPHHLHAQVSIDAMEAGLHVFVEKPVATNMREVRAMLDAAEATRKRIAVGQVRRHYGSFKFVKALLDAGCLGAVRSFDFREGAIFGWPVETVATFDKATAGGVLLDTGAHSLDTLLAWLGDFRTVRYSDDSHGGVEANCRLDLELATGVTGIIELSRTRNLRNSCIIRCEKGEVEVGVGTGGPVTLRVGGVETTAEPRVVSQGLLAPLDFTRIQIEAFADALDGRNGDCVFAESTVPLVRLFDACRESPRHMDQPWEVFRAATSFPALSGKKVLVIGGTGFIGSRLVHALARHTDATVRVLYRNASKLSAISRFDVERVCGDVTDATSLAAAMVGCDIVFNLALGRGSRAASRLTNVEAVGTLLELAVRAGVQRVVHVSTVSAYGVPPDGVLRETCTAHAGKDYDYGFSKWQGEQVGLEAARALGVSLVVLQPTVVYGPGAPSWTLNPIRMLSNGRVVLVNGGDGTCNAVYIDDVVMALLRAADSQSASGERFLISGPSPVTWRAFYRAYEAMLGRKSTVSMSLDELARTRRSHAKRAGNLAQLASIIADDAVYARLARLPLVARLKDLLPRSGVVAIKGMALGTGRSSGQIAGDSTPLPIHVWSQLDAELQAARTEVSIEKAARLLEYRPVHSFESGMALTESWARWANILPVG